VEVGEEARHQRNGCVRKHFAAKVFKVTATAASATAVIVAATAVVVVVVDDGGGARDMFKPRRRAQPPQQKGSPHRGKGAHQAQRRRPFRHGEKRREPLRVRLQDFVHAPPLRVEVGGGAAAVVAGAGGAPKENLIVAVFVVHLVVAVRAVVPRHRQTPRGTSPLRRTAGSAAR